MITRKQFEVLRDLHDTLVDYTPPAILQQEVEEARRKLQDFLSEAFPFHRVVEEDRPFYEGLFKKSSLTYGELMAIQLMYSLAKSAMDH